MEINKESLINLQEIFVTSINKIFNSNSYVALSVSSSSNITRSVVLISKIDTEIVEG